MLFKKILKEQSTFFIWLILLISAVWVLAITPYYLKRSDEDLLRVFEIKRCIEDFQIPCRWSPDLGNTHGSPIFNYVPSLPYYVGYIFFLLSNSFSFSLKAVIGIGLIGYCSSLYFYLNQKFKNNLVIYLTSVAFFLSVYLLARYSYSFI